MVVLVMLVMLHYILLQKLLQGAVCHCPHSSCNWPACKLLFLKALQPTLQQCAWSAPVSVRALLLSEQAD